MVGTYRTTLTESTEKAFEDTLTKMRELDEEELSEKKENEKEKVSRQQTEKLLGTAKESAESAHLYVREYHDKRNPNSSQRVNNMRTTATLGGIFSGVMIRATSNIFTGA